MMGISLSLLTDRIYPGQDAAEASRLDLTDGDRKIMPKKHVSPSKRLWKRVV